MKSIKQLSIFLVLILAGLTSCKDDYSVDLSQQQYVRLNQTSLSITPGEKYTIRASVDTVGSATRSFNWSILDPTIASIEPLDAHSAIITGISEGETVIKIASTDGQLQYYSDLNVGSERVIKILAIGNSFSEDAIENYLYDLAKAEGHKVMIGNMYIGGQSLEGHWTNASENNAAYQLRLIGTDGSKNSFNDKAIMEAITDENWDYISFQEVSQLSGLSSGYQEYLPKLVAYVENLTTNPDVKFVLHQTWAYAHDSNHFGFPTYNNDQMTMYTSIVNSVWQAKDQVGMDLVVPAGTAIQNGRSSYIGDRFTRDGYHLNLNIGRFTAASTWYETIFGNILDNDFIPETLSGYDALLAKTAAFEAVKNPREVTVLTEFEYPEPNDFELTSPLFIDFGPITTPAPFNNFSRPSDLKVSNLVDFTNQNTGFSIEISEPFTGTLERGLENVLGLPRSVSEDMFFSDGIHIPQSSLTLSNLNRDQRYTFAFYGSINDNRTETEFHVVGANEGNGYLDNDNNLGKLVVIEGIQPANDATITIRVKPGPNNMQWAKFFGINAMIMVPEGSPIPVEPNDFVLEEPIYIDFGLRAASSPFYFWEWPSDVPHFNLPDQSGVNTGIAMSITSRFNGENQSGVLNNTLGYPQDVSVDAFWSNRDNPESGFTVYRLNSTMKYQFVFYGSRGNAGDNRETTYKVIGANSGSGSHDASNNASDVTIIDGIQPTADGIVDIRISKGPNNNNPDGFYYINSLIISPEGYTLPGN